MGSSRQRAREARGVGNWGQSSIRSLHEYHEHQLAPKWPGGPAGVDSKTLLVRTSAASIRCEPLKRRLAAQGMPQHCGKAGQRPQQTASRCQGGVGGLLRRIWSRLCSLCNLLASAHKTNGWLQAVLHWAGTLPPRVPLSGGEECAPAYGRLLPAPSEQAT